MSDQTYSKTALQAFMRCPRHFKHTYLDKREAKADDDFKLNFGKAFHVGVEAFWLGMELPYIDRVRSMVGAVSAAYPAMVDEYMKVLLACYCDRWGSSVYEVISAEQTIEGGCSGINFKGIIDAVVKLKGKTYLVETKTTSTNIADGSFYWDLDFDLQNGLYSYLAEQKGYEVSGVIYDVIKLPSTRQGKQGRTYFDESSEEFVHRLTKEVQKNYDKYFVRRIVDVDVAVIDDAVGVAQQIEHMKSLGPSAFYRNSKACNAFGRKCEFNPVCKGDTTIDNDDLYQIRSHR